MLQSKYDMFPGHKKIYQFKRLKYFLIFQLIFYISCLSVCSQRCWWRHKKV